MFRGLRLSVILLLLLLSVCALLGELTKNDPHFQTIERLLDDPDFQRENQPIRTLRVAVFFDETLSEASVREDFESASALLERQVGVKLDVALVVRSKWNVRSYRELFRALRQRRDRNLSYDLVFGVVSRLGLPEEVCVPDDCKAGMVNEWRNVGIRSLTPRVIIHEIGHTLMIFEMHSIRGVMTGRRFESSYFTRGDREVILRNKWRDFRRQPNLIERCFSLC